MTKGSQLVVLLIIFTSFTVSAASMQKWVDKNGTVHYSDEVPAGVSSTRVNVGTSNSGSGLRPEEVRRLREIEAREKQNRYRRANNTDQDKYYSEVQKRDDNLYRCRELDRMYNSERYSKSKGSIVGQQRRLGCR